MRGLTVAETTGVLQVPSLVSVCDGNGRRPALALRGRNPRSCERLRTRFCIMGMRDERVRFDSMHYPRRRTP